MIGSTESDNDYQRIRNNGWKQFSILNNQVGVIQGILRDKYLRLITLVDKREETHDQLLETIVDK